MREPFSLHMTDEYDRIPLYSTCINNNIDSKMVKLLFDVWPGAIHSEMFVRIFLFTLFASMRMRGMTWCRIGGEYCSPGPQTNPESVMEAHKEMVASQFILWSATNPLNSAKYLIDAFPVSLRIESSNDDNLQIHRACKTSSLDTVKYLLEMCPESIGTRLPPHSFSSIG